MLIDKYNRNHNYLRISLTDNCNLRCFYCMPKEEYAATPSSKMMQANEIEIIAKTFVKLGVNKIRLTGGEPLARKDVGEIITSLSKLPVALTLTTNGTRLHEFIDVILQAGITSINVSLDTLDPEKFNLITRRNNFSRIWENIHLLIHFGIYVKINVVAIKGLNDNEIVDFISWTKDIPVEVRFIEFMPFAGNKWSSNKVLTLQQILQIVEQKYSFISIKGQPNDTSKKYLVPGHAGTFAVISTITSPFCSTCNRMRLTADGKMKNCLFSKTETDLLTALRRGDHIENLIQQSVLNKEKELGGQFIYNHEQLQADKIENRSMIAIGG